MEIRRIEVFNLNCTGKFSGQPVPKGCLGVVVDKVTFDTYQCINDGVYFSECDGILSIYQHIKGSKDGFAGRTFVLPTIEPSVMFPKIQAVRRRVFKGDLWDSVHADRAVATYLGTQVHSIGVKASNDKYDCYWSARATTEFLNRISKVVVFGEPQQSPLL